MTSEKKLASNARYHDKTIQVKIRLIKGKDDDLIAHLGGMENKTEYVKALIRADMKRETT